MFDKKKLINKIWLMPMIFISLLNIYEFGAYGLLFIPLVIVAYLAGQGYAQINNN